jgi:hypothetical protein
MSGLFPDPVAPGSVEPALLAKVTELHAAVRQWLEDTATAQKNDHIRANLPYADLMFAFGFATLGDATSAEKLLGGAREVLNGPIPPQRNPKKDADPVVVRLVRDLLLKGFEYRISEALVGNPHAGPLSPEVQAGLEEIERVGNIPPVNNPHKLAGYIIYRFRNQYRSVEPEEGLAAYPIWLQHGDQFERSLAGLRTTREPTRLVERIRQLYREGVPGKSLKLTQFCVLHDGLSLAARVNEGFASELLDLVPGTLSEVSGPAGESPEYPKRQGELLQSALRLACRFNLTDQVRRLIAECLAHVRYKPEQAKYQLLNAVRGDTVRCLKHLGMTSEIEPFLDKLQNEVLRGEAIGDLKLKYASKCEVWGTLLQSFVHIAGGWLTIGRRDRAEPTLKEARYELFRMDTHALYPKEYTEVARAYALALAEVGCETGLSGLIELFRGMPRNRVSNTWTTAQYYSRFHLNLVEDTVAAVCRMLAEPTPHVVGDSVP